MRLALAAVTLAGLACLLGAPLLGAGVLLGMLVTLALSPRLRQPAPSEPPGNRILANLSHELRTPLTSIVAYTGLLQEELEGPPRELAEKVLHSADHLLYLINDLLDLTRLQAGRLEMTMVLVPLGEVLESAYEVVEPELRRKGLGFRVELPQQVLTVSGNFHRLQQVFVNLLGNAVKFSESGEITVSIELSGAQVEVRVADQGIGIPSAQLGAVFEEFRQADDGIRRRYGGAGLGLAICRRLLELHGGSIVAENRSPRGTLMRVRLPLQPEVPQELGSQ